MVEAVERGYAGQAVAGETLLPDANLTRLRKGPVGRAVAAELKLIPGVRAEAGVEIALHDADGSESARPIGEQQRATQTELLEGLPCLGAPVRCGSPDQGRVQGLALGAGAELLDERLRTDHGPVEVRADAVLDLAGDRQFDLRGRLRGAFRERNLGMGLRAHVLVGVRPNRFLAATLPRFAGRTPAFSLP